MIKAINLIYFSPTNTTRKILKQIAVGIGVKKINEFDVTTVNKLESLSLSKDELTIFGAPVYSGRIPGVSAKRFKKFSANNSPAVAVVVYGNRAFEDALLELNDLISLLGFKTIAAGAFIGEHSFSLNGFDIAKNRPDKKDITSAKEFGNQIINKIVTGDYINELIELPGNFPYRERGNEAPEKAPETNFESCMECKRCVEVCPTHAISFKNNLQTDVAKCIWCCACIKYCSQNARIINYDKIIDIQKWLAENYSNRCEPELFI